MGVELDIFDEPDEKPFGRPSKFQDLDLEKVRALVTKGLTDRELAMIFNVAESTWYLWQHKHPHFSELLKGWKRYANERVERALYERACGYNHHDTKFFTHLGKVTSQEEIIKHIPPDPGAAKLFLINRDPIRWKDRREEVVEHTGGITLSWLEPSEPVQQPPKDWLD